MTAIFYVKDLDNLNCFNEIQKYLKDNGYNDFAIISSEKVLEIDYDEKLTNVNEIFNFLSKLNYEIEIIE